MLYDIKLKSIKSRLWENAVAQMIQFLQQHQNIEREKCMETL